MVVVPKMCVPLFVGRRKSLVAVEKALETDRKIFVITQKDPLIEEPFLKNLYQTGTVCIILQIIRLDDGNVKILIEGVERAKIKKLQYVNGYFEAQLDKVKDIVSIPNTNPEILIREVKSIFNNVSPKKVKVTREISMLILKSEDPSELADLIIANVPLMMAEKQEILDEFCVIKRLEKVKKALNFISEKEELDKKLKRDVNKQLEQSQREYYLNEQMKAIQRELGKKDDSKEEIDLLKEKVKNTKMPKEALERAELEIKRLEMMPPMTAETGVIRTYLDLLLALPWNKRTKQRLNIDKANKILDEDHFGLEKVKERILEYLSVCKLVKSMKGPILCFIGPPGVGKTSLAKSVARATGRKYVRLALGGVRDEAEIRGHRRTYIGALPGRIIHSIRKAGTKNPVFLLDEVDKMSMDFRGDPSAALLEVLDPEQNHTFSDHYLELEFDLSEVLFICTGNVLHNIPRTLQDRLEVIYLPGYTEDEKLNIAMGFLVDKQLENHGLKKKNINFTKDSILEIIRSYTREAGVRNLEREIANICRKLAKSIVSNKKSVPRKVTKNHIENFLGPKKFLKTNIEKDHRIGLVCGLAWTDAGGDIMHIETSIVDGKGELTLTGMLGDVMQESCKAALTYIRSRAKVLDIEKDFHKEKDIHIHVPEGAIPKDGPSAGIAIATTIASALTNRPVKNTIAMTGEITLRGRILPIGGFKEKLLAAHRAGIEIVLAPKENEKDMVDISKSVRNEIDILFVEHMDEVLEHSLLPQLDENVNLQKASMTSFVSPKIEEKPQDSSRI
ncbi:endopeptidase La [bacterium]|nr:endopeptidase La [bacterium]